MDEVDMDRILRNLFIQDRDLFLEWIQFNICRNCINKVIVYPNEDIDKNVIKGGYEVYE